MVLIAGLKYLFSTVTSTITFSSSGPGKFWYSLAYLGAIVSYGVVVYKSFGVPQMTKAYFQKAAMDENVQYFLLSLYWWWYKPISSESNSWPRKSEEPPADPVRLAQSHSFHL